MLTTKTLTTTALALTLALSSSVTAQETITATSIDQAQASTIRASLSSYDSEWVRTADPSLVSVGSALLASVTSLVGSPQETAPDAAASALVDAFPSFASVVNKHDKIIHSVDPENQTIVKEAGEFLDGMIAIVNRVTDDSAGNSTGAGDDPNDRKIPNAAATLQLGWSLVAAAAVGVAML